MNSNLFHNISNIATVVVGAGTGGLMAAGCTATANGGLDCSASWIDPTIAMGVVAAIAGAKLVVNIVRDGFAGLIKPQPPVQK